MSFLPTSQPNTPPEPVTANNVQIVGLSVPEVLSDASAVGGTVSESDLYDRNGGVQENGTNLKGDDLDLLFFARESRGRMQTTYSQGSSQSSSPSPYLNPTNDFNGLKRIISLPPLDISGSSSPLSDSPSLSPTSSVSSALFGINDDCEVLATPIVRDTVQSRDVYVKCMVRTRVPTPHGEVFLHLYRNNRDDKEHLAIVYDPAQLDAETATSQLAPFIRSSSLEEVWHEGETPMDRITRGAYIGRLSENGYTASSPSTLKFERLSTYIPAPLVRIHSECFTGETIGSMRCDCGEQLDEALRRIAEPITVRNTLTGGTTTIPGRGVVVYMRQEGRGIGLLSKLRAYNLQDLGHDTVQANLLLGHKADERGYEVAAAILRDLGLGFDAMPENGEAIRLLTNNPDKVQKLSEEGLQIIEHVPMVPRAWMCQSESFLVDKYRGFEEHDSAVLKQKIAAYQRSAGATLIGAGMAHGTDLEKYLRTKVLRMGHMLSLPNSDLSDTH